MTLDDLWRALALMAVFEGVVYAMAPEQMKRMARSLQDMPADILRMGGLMVAFLGVAALWLLRG